MITPSRLVVKATFKNTEIDTLQGTTGCLCSGKPYCFSVFVTFVSTPSNTFFTTSSSSSIPL